MIDDPLNYKGSNRILAIVELDDSDGLPPAVKIHYDALGPFRLEAIIKDKIVNNGTIECVE